MPLLIASNAFAQSTQFRLEDIRTAWRAIESGTSVQREDLNDPVSALAAYIRKQEHIGHGAGDGDETYSPVRDYVRQGEADAPTPIKAESPHERSGEPRDDAHAALADFVRGIDSGDSAIKFAQANPPAKKTKAAVKAKAAPADAEAMFVGSQACMGCHASHAATFDRTIMGRIFKNPRTAQEKGGCETCHGAGSLHVKAGGGRGIGGIISFRKDDTSRTVADNNAICLSCHDKGTRIHWQGSTHESRDVACTNCHTVMRNVSPKFQLKTVNEVDTCVQCHKNKRAEIWRSSHMPVREGKMTCTSCHSPHGTIGESLLKEATINDTCYKCHAEKRGPFLYEHAPVRESCVNCHDPHGSTNDFMLKISRPRLCQQCHSTLGGHPSNPRNPVSVYAIGRECQNCHSQVHGSNSPAGGRFQR